MLNLSHYTATDLNPKNDPVKMTIERINNA